MLARYAVRASLGSLGPGGSRRPYEPKAFLPWCFRSRWGLGTAGNVDRAHGSPARHVGLLICRVRISCSLISGSPLSQGSEVVGEDAPRSLAGRCSIVHGVLQVHSAPPALCPHIEWAVAGVLGVPVDLDWVSQPAAPGAVRGELSWQARPGTAGSITSALAGWNRLRFEVTEEASPGLRRGPVQLHAGARHLLGGHRGRRGHRDPREPAAGSHDRGRRVPVRPPGGRRLHTRRGAGTAARAAVGRRTRALPVRS